MKDMRGSVVKALERLNSKMVKKGGKPIVMSPGHECFLSDIPYGVSTQSLLLDIALGRPGFPAGRLTEIAGLESSSKSTLVLHALAQVQKMGGIGVLIETEQGFDTARARNIGIDSETLMIGQPESMEMVFETIDYFIRDIRGTMRFKGPVLIAWDSVAATPVNAELEGEYGDALMGAHARVISKAMRKLVGLVAQENIVLVFVNQLKTDLRNTYGGEKYVTFGGKAIRFAASVRLEVKRRKSVLHGDTKKPIGIEVVTSIIKNKIAPPMGKAEYLISFKSGLDKGQDLLDAGLLMGIISESKGWYTYDGVRFQGATWRKTLRDKLGGGTKVLKDFYDVAYKDKWIVPYGGKLEMSADKDEL